MHFKVRKLAVALCLVGAAPSHAQETYLMNHADVRHSFVVAKPIGPVFALFDPIAEKDWVPGWDPRPVHPAELSLAEASVFFLDRGDRKETWTVLRHDPEQHVAEYLATSPDFQQRWITVECESVEAGTRVNVRYRITALSSEGADELKAFDESFLRAWEAPVAAALGIGGVE